MNFLLFYSISGDAITVIECSFRTLVAVYFNIFFWYSPRRKITASTPVCPSGLLAVRNMQASCRHFKAQEIYVLQAVNCSISVCSGYCSVLVLGRCIQSVGDVDYCCWLNTDAVNQLISMSLTYPCHCLRNDLLCFDWDVKLNSSCPCCLCQSTQAWQPCPLWEPSYSHPILL